jgi:hypothetical protein
MAATKRMALRASFDQGSANQVTSAATSFRK